MRTWQERETLSRPLQGSEALSEDKRQCTRPIRLFGVHRVYKPYRKDCSRGDVRMADSKLSGPQHLSSFGHLLRHFYCMLLAMRHMPRDVLQPS